ncbi:MAG: penicillin-binding protein 2 [Candidatus Saccharibacteria bacterium]|nr:penicillin-binding protein 2 [Candidatus Saccharibacteria bacterium]
MQRRITVWYAALIFVSLVFVVRLFYLQVIRHDYYAKAALSGQLKEYELEPERGLIMAHAGEDTLPIVLNEIKYTLFADPKFITEPEKVAGELQGIIGGDKSFYESQMRQDSRYAILAKKLNDDQKQKIEALKEKGIGLREQPYRTYPQGGLAAQVLGFVNDEGVGSYGIEEALHEELKGKPGQLKAITDAAGVPLVSNDDNIIKPAEKGKKVLMTLDVSIQKQLEDILKTGLENAKSTSGSALIMDPNTGAIKAMANFPSYNPAEFFKVEDAGLFTNAAVSAPLEVGSIMKVLTTAAALNQGVVNRNTSYYDPSRFSIDGYDITNIEEDGGAGTRSVADILQLSLNTGATWLLMQMGGGEINDKARQAWYDYMKNHYRLGQRTGIEQGYEADGLIPDPKEGFGLNLQYANTSFGQGMSATITQMAAALSSVVNGGIYYQPRLVESLIDSNGQTQEMSPKVLNDKVVTPEVSQTMVELMEYVVEKNHRTYGLSSLRPGYAIGGKTGTAEISKPEGGYYEDRFNGTFMGFVGGDKPQYVIAVRVNEPKIPGYAGSKAAGPIFSNLATMLIDNVGVTPKTGN